MSAAAAADALAHALDGKFLNALAEPVRVEIIKRLVLEGECDVGTIAEGLAPDRSVVSRHLRVLHDAGLVRLRKDGRHRYYALEAAAFIHSLETILARARELISLCCPAALEGDT